MNDLKLPIESEIITKDVDNEIWHPMGLMMNYTDLRDFVNTEVRKFYETT